MYDPKKHHRRSIRLKGYDYAQEGLYFITLCTQGRAFIFGDIYQGNMHLNPIGQIAYKEWEQTEIIRKNCKIHEFIIMPDHIHGIIEITKNESTDPAAIGKFKSPSQTIGAIIRGYKIATIKKIKDFINNSSSTGELQFARTTKSGSQFAPTIEKIKAIDFKIWQRNYYDHIIRDQNAYERISAYIRNNPKKWKK